MTCTTLVPHTRSDSGTVQPVSMLLIAVITSLVVVSLTLVVVSLTLALLITVMLFALVSSGVLAQCFTIQRHLLSQRKR